jgi:hypothetical protein
MQVMPRWSPDVDRFAAGFTAPFRRFEAAAAGQPVDQAVRDR